MKKTMPVLWLLRRVRRRLPGILAVCVTQAACALLSVYFALGTRKLVDSASAGAGGEFYRAGLLLAGIVGGNLLCQALHRHFRDSLVMHLDRDWKRTLLSSLIRGDYAAVSGYHSGELLNRMTNDVRVVNDGLINVFPGMLAMLVRLIAAVAVLTALDPAFTLLLVAFGSIVLVGTGLLRRSLKKLHKQVSMHDGIVQGFLQEVLEKLLVVQAMDVAEQIEKQADKRLDARLTAQKKRKNVSLAANMGVTALSLAVSFLALIWCGSRLLQGQMSFGSLTAIIQLVNQLRGPVVGLSGLFSQYVALSASAERLMELEALEGTADESRLPAEKVYGQMQAVCGERISFSYDRDVILDGSDFTLPKGSFAVVTGASGIGKSTLLKLLLGIYPPERGQLYLDCGKERYPLNRSARSLFSYVPQGNLLLSGTLRENLLLANPAADETAVQRAIFISAMDDYLPALPDGLDTILGENGAGLSEGQAQRLAIARAVLRDAPILLLDECTSALDGETEAKVLSRLRCLQDKTCIIVTHRPGAMDLCDLHLEVKDGKIHTVPKQTK